MNFPLHIRPMVMDDIAICAVLMAVTPLWQRYGVTAESAAQRFQTGLEQKAEILVAENEKGVVGFVWLVVRGVFERSGYIPLIGVDAASRGGGVGRMLLAAAEGRFARSCQDVFLLCSDFNTEAQRFYERLGYARVGAIPDYVIEGVTEVIYRKRLR